MAHSDLERALADERRGVERTLSRLLRGQRGVPTRLKAAMAHSLLGGGKRLRPILLLWTWDAVAAGRRSPVRPRDAAMEAACALEMLHTYSLIHDDLPAMDDDDLRRGRPSCHVAFDEATAILAGDGLQALGFAILARVGETVAGRLVESVAHAVGPAGMVGGQQYDLDAEGAAVNAAMVRRIHLNKTARLLAVSMTAGALLAGGDAPRLDRINEAGLQLGLAFQGADDLLDVTASSTELGKTAGKDAVCGKATWVRLEGAGPARARTLRHGRRGLGGLVSALPASPASDRLQALAVRMWERER